MDPPQPAVQMFSHLLIVWWLPGKAPGVNPGSRHDAVETGRCTVNGIVTVSDSAAAQSHS
jgi:hypothetical protein